MIYQTLFEVQTLQSVVPIAHSTDNWVKNAGKRVLSTNL